MQPKGAGEVEEEEVTPSVPRQQYWVRQPFVISSGQASQGYLDLIFDPIPETIRFKTEHSGDHIYNVDFSLIENITDERFRRISWRPEDCPNGNGLLDSMKAGFICEVAYAKLKKSEEP